MPVLWWIARYAGYCDGVTLGEGVRDGVALGEAAGGWLELLGFGVADGGPLLGGADGGLDGLVGWDGVVLGGALLGAVDGVGAGTGDGLVGCGVGRPGTAGNTRAAEK
jgi:hypothetical protein